MRRKVLITILLFIILIISYNINVYSVINTNVSIGQSLMNQFDSIGNIIIGTIRYVGIFISVGALMVMGIRYMVSSVEEKAMQKESMIMYCIGALLLFGIVNIIAAIYDLIKSI